MGRVIGHWLNSLFYSLVLNLIIFLVVPYLTFLKPVRPRKIYAVDLFRYSPPAQREVQQTPKKTTLQKFDKEVENINPQQQEPQSAEQTLYEIGDLDSVPQILEMVKPEYPELLRQQNKEGRVVLRVLVNYYGYVEEVIIFDSSGQDLFDKSASDAVKRWRFSTPTVKGKPASVWFILPVRFELE